MRRDALLPEGPQHRSCHRSGLRLAFNAEALRRHAKFLSTLESAHRISLSASLANLGVENRPRFTKQPLRFAPGPPTPMRPVDAQNSYRHWNPRSGFHFLRRWQIWVSRIAPDSPNNRFDWRPDLRRRCAPTTRKIPIGTGIRALIFSICVAGKFVCQELPKSPLCLEFHGPLPIPPLADDAGSPPPRGDLPPPEAVLPKGAHRGPSWAGELAQRPSGPSCVEAAFRGPRSELASFGKEPPR